MSFVCSYLTKWQCLSHWSHFLQLWSAPNLHYENIFHKTTIPIISLTDEKSATKRDNDWPKSTTALRQYRFTKLNSILKFEIVSPGVHGAYSSLLNWTEIKKKENKCTKNNLDCKAWYLYVEIFDEFYRAIFQKERYVGTWSLFVFTMMLNEIFIGYTTWLSSEVFFLNKSYTNFVKKGGGGFKQWQSVYH